jgi:hypothetical protein
MVHELVHAHRPDAHGHSTHAEPATDETATWEAS